MIEPFRRERRRLRGGRSERHEEGAPCGELTENKATPTYLIQANSWATSGQQYRIASAILL